jgi:hypothetical protein
MSATSKLTKGVDILLDNNLGEADLETMFGGEKGKVPSGPNGAQNIDKMTNHADVHSRPAHNSSLTETGKSQFATFHHDEAKESAAELEVLKCVLNREAYMKKLKLGVRTMGRIINENVTDLMAFVREAGLDVVEAIVAWRRTRPEGTAAAYEWNGQNYLTKVLILLPLTLSFPPFPPFPLFPFPSPFVVVPCL